MNGKNLRNRIVLIATTIFIVIFSYHYPYGLNILNYRSPESSELQSVNILIVGDIMLDRNVRNIIDKKGFDGFFKGIKDIVRGSDITVANLEGAFTPYSSITSDLVSKELQFTFDPSLAPKLADLGFDILGLANNHSYNFGREGLEMTRRYIGSSGMIYYGDPFNKDEISTIITKDGIKIAFVGFHEFYYTNFDKIFTEISRLDKIVDVVMVTPHWGLEYQKEPTEKMVEWAHDFINSGADAVIGAHPHVVGNIEIYKNKKIYYSLGNFAFDQYFSEETMNGLGVIVGIEKIGNDVELRYTDVPVRVDREGVREQK